MLHAVMVQKKAVPNHLNSNPFAIKLISESELSSYKLQIKFKLGLNYLLNGNVSCVWCKIARWDEAVTVIELISVIYCKNNLNCYFESSLWSVSLNAMWRLSLGKKLFQGKSTFI